MQRFQLVLSCLINLGDCSNDCKIHYDLGITQKYHHPMIINLEGDGFLYPILDGKTRILQIPDGESVFVTCPGKKNKLLLDSRPGTYITCTRGQLYNGNQVVTWPQLGCRSKPRPSLDRQDGTCGSSNKGRMYSIHWPIRRGVDIQQVAICFDKLMQTTLFTYHRIHGRHIDAKTIESSRPAFKKADMFTVRADDVYAIKSQKALFSHLLRSQRHLTGEKEHYLARGHLSPDSDFIMLPEQEASYYYANAVPQWQAVNNGNWKSLENSVRDLAEKRRTTLKVWTGVHGVLHLPDTRQNLVELFLGFSARKRVIPVPALMWKIIHDPSRQEAIAIIEVNDVGGLGSSDHLSLQESPCHDLCSQVRWVDWNVRDLTSGRTFCCTVQDLRNSIPNVPDLRKVRLLSSV